MLSWRHFAAVFCVLSSLLASKAVAVEICELDAANIPPSCAGFDAYSVFPAPPQGPCPEGSRPELSCTTKLPVAQIRCRPEGNHTECFASPNGLNIPLSYAWSSSNPNVAIWGDSEDVVLSCDADSNVVISVVISDPYGRTSSAQKLLYCRKPRAGTQPR